MKYVFAKFTLPAGSSKVTQAEWDRIFGKSFGKSDEADNKKRLYRKSGGRKKGVK